ncbi:MAG TPA: hypothetical protein VFA35_02835, partial [Burkholderiaceae bacterium]|nr:hypothetical protein [Burkholderiaceae bacterium]
GAITGTAESDLFMMNSPKGVMPRLAMSRRVGLQRRLNVRDALTARHPAPRGTRRVDAAAVV